MSTRDQIKRLASGNKPAETEAPGTPKVTAPTPSNGAAEKPAKAPKTVKVAQDCKCGVPDVKGTNGGCAGGKTKGVFAPGHDAKLTGYLTREVVAGNLTADQAVEDLKAKGGSALLQGKLKAAIAREVDKAERKAATQATKDAAKAEKERASAFAKEQAELAKADLKAKQDA